MPKVIFAKSFFESFDGTQEELDQLTADIEKMFADMTPEQIMEMSVPVSLDEQTELSISETLAELESGNKKNLH